MGHTILVAAYHILQDEDDYHDLGATYLDQQWRELTPAQCVRRLQPLGYTITLALEEEPAA